MAKRVRARAGESLGCIFFFCFFCRASEVKERK